VLIPLDGSPLAEQAVEPAVALGGLTQADFTLVQAVEPEVLIGDDLGGFGTVTAGLADLEQMEEQARGYLEGVARRLRARSLRVRTSVVTGKHPVAAILQGAREHGADLIALATHGYGGVTRLLLGSVADKVVRGAPTPVLVFRPAGPVQES
jgi:nucleotide-binding universal stress UspA family protein